MAKFQKSHRLDDAYMICPPSDVSGIINAEVLSIGFVWASVDKSLFLDIAKNLCDAACGHRV